MADILGEVLPSPLEVVLVNSRPYRLDLTKLVDGFVRESISKKLKRRNRKELIAKG